MNHRQLFINYVKHGGEFFASPQIGAGAGFDARLACKQWLSDATIEDTFSACARFDMVPLYNASLPDLTQLVDGFGYESAREYDPHTERRTTQMTFYTPKHRLNTTIIEQKFIGGAQTKGWITEEDGLDALEYYLDALLTVTDFSPITAGVKNMRERVGHDVPLDVQWAMQPYELLCFPDTATTAIFAMECPERCTKLREKILRLDEKLLPAVAAGGADFVFLGGPGAEMISPRFYRDYIVPYSKIVSEMAHNQGLLIYSHICSPIEPMLSMGFYNQMGIDLFETLSAPPVGNIKGIEDAFMKLDPNICTRGNVGLDALLNEDAQAISDESLRILTAARRLGRKHILAASDYLFYNTKIENVAAMCRAVKQFNAQ